MIISMNWLSDYVKVNMPPRDFSEAMTMSGSKVEGYKIEGEDILNVVVGKILKVEKHPDSDHLVICQLDVGANEAVQIVTGANNVFEGALVPAALHKSTLPGGVKITKGKLRGVESHGMMCSLGELGLTVNDYPGAIEDGILILNEGNPGDDIRDVLGLRDTAVEFEITSNRPDCLSVLGLAREAAATFGTPLTLHEININGAEGKIEDEISVEVKNTDLCRRYSCMVVKNVKIGPSPMWLRNRLRVAGVRPINNIVDITNYVMLEYGQPLHAFDKRFLKGDKIVVRSADEGEKITTLDGVEYPLTSEMLVIADAEKPVAVAGVMGGEYSGIMDDTTTVVFESASFNGHSVRMTSKKLGLRTESSARFEKGLNPEITEDALHRAVSMAIELAGGTPAEGEIDIFSSPTKEVAIPFDSDYINRFIGTDISKADMIKMLESLEFKVENGMVYAPNFRIDITCKADIAEEVARIYGYNLIPTTPLSGEAAGGFNPEQSFENALSDTVLGLGYTEIQTYSFVSPKYYDKILLPSDSPLRNSVVIRNPLGEDSSVMRTTTIPSMLEILSRNFKNRNESAMLFEIGKEYIPTGADTLPNEVQVLTLGSYGSGDFFAMKGAVEAIFAKFKITDVDFLKNTSHPTFHPGRCADILIGEKAVGVMGEIHPVVASNYDIQNKIYICKIYLSDLFDNRKDDTVIYTQLPKFPAATRDLSLVCDEYLPVSAIEKVIKKCAGHLLEKIKLFDLYQGEQIEKNKKSVSFSLTLRSKDSTITDADADRITDKILKELDKINVVIRK